MDLIIDPESLECKTKAGIPCFELVIVYISSHKADTSIVYDRHLEKEIKKFSNTKFAKQSPLIKSFFAHFFSDHSYINKHFLGTSGKVPVSLSSFIVSKSLEEHLVCLANTGSLGFTCKVLLTTKRPPPDDRPWRKNEKFFQSAIVNFHIGYLDSHVNLSKICNSVPGGHKKFIERQHVARLEDHAGSFVSRRYKCLEKGPKEINVEDKGEHKTQEIDLYFYEKSPNRTGSKIRLVCVGEAKLMFGATDEIEVGKAQILREIKAVIHHQQTEEDETFEIYYFIIGNHSCLHHDILENCREIRNVLSQEHVKLTFFWLKVRMPKKWQQNPEWILEDADFEPPQEIV
ncbi:MAG: hypothetical protein ABIG63_14395 [Chloroflexota bacterium]